MSSLHQQLPLPTFDSKKDERALFECWVSASPYNKPTLRCSAESSWPGTYKDYSVELAWEAWQFRSLARPLP